MASEKHDYQSILADLETKKMALESTIASLRSALAIGALGHAGGDMPTTVGFSANNNEQSIELPNGALLGKSIPGAIKLYLSAVKRKQTIKEIATALREGGVESTSQDFIGVITGSMNRLKASGEVLRFKDGWGLAELYPESLRSRISLVSKPPKKKKVNRATKRAKSTISKVSKPENPLNDEPMREGPQTAVMNHVHSLRGTSITTQQVAGALHMRPQTVALILAKMAHAGVVAKNLDGSFLVCRDAVN